MEISTRKAVWWYALAAGVGASLMFAYLFVVERQIPVAIYSWPIATVILSMIAASRLRVSYREEPGPGKGFWQLSISDLVVAALVCGLLLTTFQSFTTKQFFLREGIPLSFVTSGHFVVGILIAARRRIQRKAKRYAFAFGFVLRNYGALTVGAGTILSLVIAIFGSPGRTFYYVTTIFFFQKVSGEEWLFYPVQAGLFMLPAGLLFCWWGRSEEGRLIE